MAWWTVSTDSDFCDFSDRIMPVFNACEIPKIITQCWLLTLHTDFYRSSDDIIHFMRYSFEISLFLLESIILKLFYFWGCFFFFADEWSSANLYFWETLPLWDPSFIPNHITDLLSFNINGSKTFLELFLCSTTYFSNLFLLFPNIFVSAENE